MSNPVDIAYIALGSNLGDRDGYLTEARKALSALPGTRMIAATAVEETAPIGDEAQGPYLTQMVALETTLPPRHLLDELHRIEAEAGRRRDKRWGPRTLDLDIVMFDRQRVSEPDLQVPHPELPNREFWQRELAALRRPS
jgi:2-amino-4-hydroxy-6-hydroxymethyldihydropteridine diphosphokinase